MLYIRKKSSLCYLEKSREDLLLNGVEEMERIFETFEQVKNRITEDNLSLRIGYRFPNQETEDQ